MATYNGNDNNNTYNGTTADDQIYGYGGKDTLNGSGGNDYIDAGDGADTLNGGAGSDTLYGYNGADTYLFAKGDGQDSIDNSHSHDDNGVDVVKFGDVASTGVSGFRSGNDLVLGYGDSDSDSVTIWGFFSDTQIYSLFAINSFKFSDGVSWGYAELFNHLSPSVQGTANKDTLYGVDGYAFTLNGLGGDDSLTGGTGNDTLNGDTGNDSLHAGSGSDILNGGDGNDYINAGDGADTLNGGAGSDTLYGDNGADILNGGAGSDTLYGDNGADTYLFVKGDGQDTIYNYHDDDGVDVVKFGDVASTGVSGFLSGSRSLVLSYGNGDSVSIENFFSNTQIDSDYAINSFKFSDGVGWGIAELMAHTTVQGTANNDTLFGVDGYALTLNGLTGNDTLYGGTGNDTLNGGDGNDYLEAGDGSDTLNGGTGSDTLYGYNGANTYLFAKGDGQDTIDNYHDDNGIDVVKFGDVASTGVSGFRSGNSLVLGYGNGDSVTIRFFFSETQIYSDYAINSFKFSDGVGWGIAELMTHTTVQGTANNDTLFGVDGYALTLNGLAGNDTLYGGIGNDTLNGGDGNDYLNARDGVDTYLFAQGDGQDAIDNYHDDNGVDVVKFSDVASTGVSGFRSGNSLVLGYGKRDSVSIQNFFSGTQIYSYFAISSFKFNDGVGWGYAELFSYANTVQGTANNDTLYGVDGYALTLNGLAGNDTLLVAPATTS